MHLGRNCCLQDGAEHPAGEMAEEFDRLAGTDLFLPMFERYASGRSIPAYEKILGSPGFSTLLDEAAAYADGLTD